MMSMYADDKRFEDFHAIFGGVRKPISVDGASAATSWITTL